MVAIGFSPQYQTVEGQSVTVLEAEASLTKWFGRAVVLTSSGRAALHLCFQQMELKRYESRIAIAPRTAQCVFDAVTRFAFPVDPSSDFGPVDATLLIHQYGHSQHDRPGGAVVEDICHAFFASADSGARAWAGDMAVFSLPKFFAIAGMAGGIVAASEDMAMQLRARRDAAPRLTAAQKAVDRVQLHSRDPLLLEQLYLRALLHPAPCSEALAGMAWDFEAIGRARSRVTRIIVDALPRAVLDEDWREMCLSSLPFAIPVFAEPEHLAALVSELNLEGYGAGVYRVDRARKMSAPDVQAGALLPCHDQIDGDRIERLIEVLQTWSATYGYG